MISSDTHIMPDVPWIGNNKLKKIIPQSVARLGKIPKGNKGAKKLISNHTIPHPANANHEQGRKIVVARLCLFVSL